MRKNQNSQFSSTKHFQCSVGVEERCTPEARRAEFTDGWDGIRWDEWIDGTEYQKYPLNFRYTLSVYRKMYIHIYVYTRTLSAISLWFQNFMEVGSRSKI